MITAEQEIDSIAKKYLGIDTLRERMSDELDFHNIAVWDLKEALLEAYTLGANSLNKEDNLHRGSKQNEIASMCEEK